jgi:diacylglycerol kinase
MSMNKISRLLRLPQFANAFNGLRLAMATQIHMQIHTVVALLVVLLAWWLEVSLTEWCLLLLCIGLVISFELVNTAIETYCDYATPERHPQIGKVKDIAAAAVLVSAMVAAVVGCIIFLPKLLL